MLDEIRGARKKIYNFARYYLFHRIVSRDNLWNLFTVSKFTFIGRHKLLSLKVPTKVFYATFIIDL